MRHRRRARPVWETHSCPTCAGKMRQETPGECAGRRGFALGTYCPQCLETILDEHDVLISQRATVAFREKFKASKVEFAPRDLIASLSGEVRQVVQALGHPEAFVTNDSTVGDFLCSVSEDTATAELRRATVALGFPLGEDDLIWQVAARLRAPT